MTSEKTKPVRLYQLAHHLNLSTKTIIEELGQEGFILKHAHLSPITRQMLTTVLKKYDVDGGDDSQLDDFKNTIVQWEKENPSAPILTRRHDMQRESIGKKLRAWRKSKKMSQKALADMAGISPVTINQLETKDRTPRAQTFGLLLEALGITKEQFFAEADKVQAKVAAAKATPSAAPTYIGERRGRRVRLSNIDLELLNQVLNLNFDEKLALLKHLQTL